MLVAEIPKAGNRWAQANFDLANYEGFFGAKVGSQRRISLHHVDASGALGEVESRPSVEVASQNYRFELAAARGRDYPSEGSPIGVFLRLGTGEFLYALLLPGEAGYRQVDNLLSAMHCRRTPGRLAGFATVGRRASGPLVRGHNENLSVSVDHCVQFDSVEPTVD